MMISNKELDKKYNMIGKLLADIMYDIAIIKSDIKWIKQSSASKVEDECLK